MSTEDRERWDARYAAGAYGTRHHPSTLLADWIGQQAESLHSAPTHWALDVACGAGRNSLFLAQQGYRVLGLDVSAVAIAQAREKAGAIAADGAVVKPVFREHDLDTGMFNDRHSVDIADDYTAESFHLICMFRYLDLKLVAQLLPLLAQDGVLLVEVNLQVPQDRPRTDANLAGPPATPKASRFRAAPGALLAAVQGGQAAQSDRRFQIELAEEGWFKDPDGADASLARVVVRRIA